MNIAIIGCGLVGKKRAKFAEWAGMNVLWAVDTSFSKACDIGEEICSLTPTDNVHDAINDSKVEAVVVATPHMHLYAMSKLALEKKKKLFIEITLIQY